MVDLLVNGSWFSDVDLQGMNMSVVTRVQKALFALDYMKMTQAIALYLCILNQVVHNPLLYF